MYRFVFLTFVLALLASCGDDASDENAVVTPGFNEEFPGYSSATADQPSGPNSENPGVSGGTSSSQQVMDSIPSPIIMDEIVEDSTQVSDVSQMPPCDASNEGEAMMVMSEKALYFCSEGSWIANIVETVGVSCADGNLIPGEAVREVSIDPLTGFEVGIPVDSVTKLPLYSREGVVVAGIAEKGPFRHGASVTIVELDSSRVARLAETTLDHKTCITTVDGSYAFGGLNLVYPYVRVTTSGYYKSELTGGLSSEPVALNAVADLTERDSVNVNVLTHIDAVTSLRLVEQSGFNTPIRMVKEQSLQRILFAFSIKIDGFNDALFAQAQGNNGGLGGQAPKTITKIADEINLYDNDEFSAALLAVSVMLESHGSGQEMLLFADSIAQKIAGSGNWDNWDSRARLADWLMSLDVNGGFEKIRKNVESWNLGPVPDFEKYLRNFWVSEYRFPNCDASIAGMVLHNSLSQSPLKASYYADPNAPKIRFTCDATLGRWRAATDIEKDTVGLGADTSKYDGAIRPGVINKDLNYVYEASTGLWRPATSDDIMDFADVEDVYNSLSAGESVVFVLRHAERTDETGPKGHLTDNGKAQAKSVGAKFKNAGRIYFAYSGYTRTLETCEGIAEGAGQVGVTPDILDGLNGEWFVKSGEPSIEDVSRWAYTGSPAGSFYVLEDRAKELVSDYVLANRSKLQKVNFYISHDRMVLPLAVYASQKKVDLRYFDMQGNRNWVNYLAGAAIIFDGAGNVRYVPVRGLESGTMKL